MNETSLIQNSTVKREAHGTFNPRIRILDRKIQSLDQSFCQESTLGQLKKSKYNILDTLDESKIKEANYDLKPEANAEEEKTPDDEIIKKHEEAQENVSFKENLK